MKTPGVCEVAGREVEVTLTVTGKVIGDRRSITTTETFPATVRTRMVYEGRPMFLAADPPVEVESEVAS